MIAEAVQPFEILASLDRTHDLKGRRLKITLSGVKWEDGPQICGYSKDELLRFYYYLTLTRAVDLELVKLNRKGLALGKQLRCLGNEASAIGATLALKQDEWVTTAIRDLGAFLVRGIPTSAILAQACGRVDGPTRGWDGSLHLPSRKDHLSTLVSHLGTLMCTAAGCAFKEIYSGTGKAALAFIGDGSTSTGDFHEALNIASVLHLPLVVVIETISGHSAHPDANSTLYPRLRCARLATGLMWKA